eukprot:1948129-Prymnesium_polylepis.1
MGTGVSCGRERVHSCEKAVGRMTESVGSDRCLPGDRLVPAGGPSGAKRGLGVVMLSRPFDRFAID